MRNKKVLKNILKGYIPLIFIIGIFVFLCSFIANRSIWFDEAYSAQTIKGSFSEIAETTAADVHPPLYYWLLKIWSVPFGRSNFALRSFSIFCGAIAIIFAYLIFKKWSKSTKMATFFALMFAICPFFIYYSTEIRMYSLSCAIVMASIFILDLALERKKLKFCISYALLLTTALYTHYFSVLAFFAEYIYIFFRHRKTDPGVLRKLVFVSVLALILYIPWIPSLVYQVSMVEDDFWIEPFSLNTFVHFFSESLVRYEDVENNLLNLILVSVTLVTFAATVLATYKTMGEKTKNKVILIASVTFIPFLTLFILSIPPLSPLYVSRYLTYSLTLIWVLIAIFIAQAYKVKPKLSKILLLLMLACAIVGFTNVYKENDYSAEVDKLIAKIEIVDGDEEVPVVFARTSGEAFNIIFYQTEKHHVYIIDPMESWVASRPLTKYGDNYIDDFIEFKGKNDVFWYIIPSYTTISKMKHSFEKESLEVVYAEKIGGYEIIKLKKKGA